MSEKKTTYDCNICFYYNEQIISKLWKYGIQNKKKHNLQEETVYNIKNAGQIINAGVIWVYDWNVWMSHRMWVEVHSGQIWQQWPLLGTRKCMSKNTDPTC